MAANSASKKPDKQKPYRAKSLDKCYRRAKYGYHGLGFVNPITVDAIRCRRSKGIAGWMVYNDKGCLGTFKTVEEVEAFMAQREYKFVCGY